MDRLRIPQDTGRNWRRRRQRMRLALADLQRVVEHDFYRAPSAMSDEQYWLIDAAASALEQAARLAEMAVCSE